MSLAADLAKRDNTAKSAEIKRLNRRIEQLSATLESARKARPAPKLKPAVTKRITGDLVRVLVPDSHGSSQDNAAVAAFLADLTSLNPDEVILLGDHLDCGGFLAEHHVMGYVAQTEYSYEEDVLFGNAFLDAIQKCAPKAEIFYLEGNHEFRTERWAVTEALRNSKDAEFLRKMVSPEILLHLKTRGIKYYRQAEKYDGLTVAGTIKRGKCFFTHGFSTAKNAAAAHLAKIGGNITYGHCFSDDTEVLTSLGWKKFSQITIGQDVMTVSLTGCKTEWQPVKDVFSHDHYKELVQFKSTCCDLLVTPDHAMVTTPRGVIKLSGSCKLNRVPAKELEKLSAFAIPCGGINQNSDYPILDDEIKLLAWIITEGNISKNNGYDGHVRISQSEKPKVGPSRIIEICHRLGIKTSCNKRYSKGKIEHGQHRNFDAYRINLLRTGSEQQIDRVLAFIPGKTLQWWMCGLSKRQFDILFEELILGDGCKNSSAKYSYQYAAKNILDCDVLQALCSINGYRSCFNRRSDCNTVTVNTRGISHFASAPTTSRVGYDGTVWCCSVENQTLVVRRNGKVAVCGNTHRADFAIKEPVNVGTIAAYSPGCLCIKQPLWQHTNPTEWTHGHGVQLVDRRTQRFFQMNIPIVDGVSMMKPFLDHGYKK